MSNDLNKVPISDKVKKGMSLTAEDQQFIKRLLDRQDESFSEAFDKNITELTGALAEVIQANNNKMFAELESIGKNVAYIMKRLDRIEERLDAIELSLDDKDKRLMFLERYASIPQTIIRHAIAIFMGVVFGIVIGWVLHSLI